MESYLKGIYVPVARAGTISSGLLLGNRIILHEY